MNEKDDDNYLEYMLHFLHSLLVLWMIFFYTKCVLFMNRAANKIAASHSTSGGERLALKRRRQNFRLSLHYLFITTAFVFLIACWLAYKLVGTDFVTVGAKKVAYFANSMIAGLIFVSTNSTFWRDCSSLFK
uniref:Uncharacterized protein n=1 Tax=Romanomermis culicivorax TaxID=13658 RepID=A0A915JUV9_ROMCU